MNKGLMSLEELSQYLGINEKKILSLVEEKVITAYNIGGEYLRFRKEQIDATRAELESRIKDSDRISAVKTPRRERGRLERMRQGQGRGTFSETLSDFFYFYDFYIISGVLILVLLAFILKG